MKSFACLLAGCLLLLISCGKDDGNYVPDIIVNFHAPLTDPRLERLNSAGGAVVIDGYGVAGLVLYRKPDGSYVAYDRCSTVNVQSRCAVTLDDPTLTVTDPCSGAKFSLYDGSPVKAPAKRSLKQYAVYISGYQLSVIN